MSGDVAFEGQITFSGEPGAKLSLSSAVRRLVACLIGVCIASGISLESLAGQTLRGRILDSETREPVRLAYVGLLTEGESMAVATLADTAGFFEVTAPDPMSDGPLGMAWVWTVGGLVVTVASAWAVVWAATDVAERAGLAQGFIGFSLVAVGTSLPELVTVVAAARRDESGLILGSLLGSNVFNSLCVGAGVFLAGDGVVTDVALQTRGSVAAIVVAFVVVIFMSVVSRKRIDRLEGVVLLGGYAAVLTLLATSAGT